jgi:hypothetical protein
VKVLVVEDGALGRRGAALATPELRVGDLRVELTARGFDVLVLPARRTDG